MIVAVDESNILDAARIHSASWRESHRGFCSPEFISLHSTQHQQEFLCEEIAAGKKLFLLKEKEYVGMVSIYGNLIENLYVLPNEQRQGYGTQLLLFAIRQCAGRPTLWILENNKAAYALYYRHGFRLTGNYHRLSDSLSEVEMVLEKEKCDENFGSQPE